MSELSSEHGEEEEHNPPPRGQDIEGLKHQLDEQQSMISQLKDMLQSNEQQLVSKEKEVEEYGAKLSSIKFRTKTSKRGVKSLEAKMESEDVEGESHLETTSVAGFVEEKILIQSEISDEKGVGKKEDKKAGKSSEKTKNILLLRKNLEENRMKFKQRGKEMSESKKTIEDMVENLRSQLEERDQVIKKLQKSIESKSVPHSSIEGSVETTHDNIGSEQVDKQEMYAQIVYKDNKIVELNNRVMELELNILDLQENLKEKDAVIDARTKAITLMSEDMSRKSKSTLDSLDDTREQMRLMQNNFIALEAQMKEEKEQLKRQLEDKNRKLKHVEESHIKLESHRFDLTARIAELQEKVVHLQTINSELHKEVSNANKHRDQKDDRQDRVEELLKSLDETNKQMIKVKAQHKNKVKSLVKQIDSLKRVCESSDEVLRLQQRVAELEEDKGNLQLHLVDFDELKDTESSWKQRIRELEDKVKQQNSDLDYHVHALSRLESEKLNLIEDFQADRLQIDNLELELKTLKIKLIDIENLKVAAEMKAVELEELVDIVSREKTELTLENKVLSDEKSEYKQLVDSLQQEKAELLEEVMTLQAQVRESNPGDTDSNRSEFQMVSSSNSDEEKWKRLSASEEALAEEKHVKDSSNIELSVKLLESELDDTRRIVSEQKDIINDLTLKVEAKEEEIEMHQEVISKLEQLGQEVNLESNSEDANKISEILKELNEMTGDLEEWKKRCSEVEDRLKSLGDEKTYLEQKLEEVTNENSVLDAQLKLQKQVSEELASKLKEESSANSAKTEMIKNLENTISQHRHELEMKENHLSALMNQLGQENLSAASHDYEGSIKEEYENIKKLCLSYENEIAEKNEKISELTAQLQEKVRIEGSVELQIQDATESSSRLLNEKLEMKDDLIKQLEIECQNLRDSYATLKSVAEEKRFEEQSDNNSKNFQELQGLLNDKERLLLEKENELEKSSQKIKSVSEKVKKIAVNLKAKTVVIQNLEEKEKKLLEALQEKEELLSLMNLEREKLSGEVETLKLTCEEKENAALMLTDKFKTDLLMQGNKIEEITSQNKHLITVNGKLQQDVLTGDEKQQLLRSQISELEEEIDNLRNGLNIRDGEISILKEQCKGISNLEEEKKVILDNNMESEKKIQELITEIIKKEEAITQLSLKLDELSKCIDIKNDQIESHSFKYRELEQIIVSKDMQITALEDRMSGFQNSWGALEAKLQEREAFIESLEQELASSHSRQQHMEEGLSFIEERRRSLEAKFTALGEQLQESDRIKEEAEEHEGLLENRLASLASSEEVLRKRLESLTDQNAELSQRLSDLGFENESLKKNLLNAENNIKVANKELERLASFENAYQQSQQSIEVLEGDLKRHTIGFERSLKERELETRRYIENLELDMKNLGSQLEVLENEKRCLMEHCEKLNDTKINLEEDLETLVEKSEASGLKIQDLENVINQNESKFNLLILEKNKEISELKQRVQSAEGNFLSSASSSVGASLESEISKSDNSDSNQITQLRAELKSLSDLLTEKETEVQSYQKRLLQLQFGGIGLNDKNQLSTTKDQEEMLRVKQLENSVFEMEEKIKFKDSQLEELKSLLASTNNEMTSLQQQLSNSCKKIEEMSVEMCHLQDIVKNKDNQLQIQMEEISVTNSNKLSHQLATINVEHHTQLTSLQYQNTQLFEELIQERAKNIVNDILSSAQLHVEELRSQEIKSHDNNEDHVLTAVNNEITVAETMTSEHSENVQSDTQGVPSVVTFDTSLDANEEFVVLNKVHFASQSEFSATQELVEKLGDLTAELDVVKSEKKSALLKIEQLEGEINRLLNVEKQLMDLQGRLHLFVAGEESTYVGKELFSKESSIDSEFLSERGSAIHHGNEIPIAGEPECVVDLGDSQALEANKPSIIPGHVDIEGGWSGETLEEEGWGWGADEARLEEEHLQKQRAALSSSPSGSELQQHVGELKEKIQELEKEKYRITEELKASQVRSGKMLKKLKDLKLKNESLMRENQELAQKKVHEFESLDLAIEEELKIRIDSLEKELKECRGERDSVKVEKEGLQKRMEVLSAANERLVEREQALDTEYWQNKNKELINQIETLKWRIEELMEEKASESKEKFSVWGQSEMSDPGIPELQEQVTALSTDNEQLQCMLEEQRNLRVAAEAALKDIEQFTSSKQANLMQQESNVKEEYLVLQENYELVCKELEQFRSLTSQDSLIAENSVLRENYEILSRELEQLRSNSNNELIAAEYMSMRNNYEAIYNEMEQLRSQVDLNNTLRANYESLRLSHDQLVCDMNNVQKEYCSLNDRYETIQIEKSLEMEESSLKYQTMEENYNTILNQIKVDNNELKQKLEQLSLECESHITEVKQLRDTVQKYENTVSEMKLEHEELNAMNVQLSEKYELLKHSSVPAQDVSASKSDIKSTSVAETFMPIGLFAQSDHETAFDMIQNSTLDSHALERNLQDEIKECEDKIAKLEKEKNLKINEITVLREMFSREQEEWANTEQALNQKIEILHGELEMIKESANRESELRESLMVKEHELSNIKSQLSYLEETVSKSQYRVEDLEAQLIQKEEEMQDTSLNVENQENMIQQIVKSKELELSNLREALAMKEQEQFNLLVAKDKDIDNLKLQISDLEAQIESLITMKNQDLQNLMIKMRDMETKMHAAIADKEKEVDALKVSLIESNAEIQELSKALQEKEQQIIELQETLEAREDEVQEAVYQIRDRNLEIQKLKELSGSDDASSMVGVEAAEAADESQKESSQQNELDLALYMLHQRDVRCEELTLELMQLLEERDTLQLRLSTALRINEDLRNKSKSLTSSPVKDRSSHSLHNSSDSNSDIDESNEKITEEEDIEQAIDVTVKEPQEDLQVLADKLSQLHSVDYRRDVTLQEEREQRHSEQVMLLQPRGTGVLLQSNYTLSRDVQSPSTVLLNWIWGRSTPKVMHI